MTATVQLRETPPPDVKPAAWFLPGASAAGWLAELVRCDLAGVNTRLFIIPRSDSDVSPVGLLAIATDAPVHRPRGLACRVLADCLYLPLDAALYPPLADAEVRSLCPHHVQFFHPAFGLSAFDADSTLRVWNLLNPPAECENRWNFVRPGMLPLPQLSAIVLAEPPSLDDVFGGAENDIGSDPIADLPPAPDEPSQSKAAEARRKLRRLLARGLSESLKRLPHTGSRRTWVNKLEDWANRHLRHVSDQLERLRNKELERLLHLLKTDPEAGLRHAIPLNNFLNRGVSPPSSRLSSHSLNFDPNRLGGLSADFWNVPYDMQQNLRRLYREMADREMQLGRHQRAAYIYAQLLGDLVSAAHTLRQGRFYREAALLYEEHLRNPLEAARCLAEGGLLPEAIERYEKLDRWLDVADLHARLGNQAAAEAAIRRVVAERLAQDDVLEAAKLIEDRLHQTDEALGLLQNAWPGSKQAANCIGAYFQMLARLGRHDAALEQLGQLERSSVPDHLALGLLSVLGNPARTYPHATVRHRSLDFSRKLVSRQLARPALPEDESSRLVESLVRLVPQDRLLARDGNRFLAARREARRQDALRKPPPLPAKKPFVIRRIQLPRQMEWLCLRNEWHSFFAAGVTNNRLTVVRGIWEGEFQSVSWDCPVQLAKNGLLFEPTGDHGNSLAVAVLNRKPLLEQRFPATPQFFNQACTVGTPSWYPLQVLPFAFGENSVWCGHVAAGQAVLSCHDKRGKLLRTLDVTADLLTDAERTERTRLCAVAIGNGVALALGNRLIITRGDGGMRRVELPGQVIGLAATPLHTRQGIAILMDHGAAMHWVGSDQLIELDRDIASPKGLFVPGGPLVLISEGDGILLDVTGQGVQSACRFDLAAPHSVGISATSSPNQFAILTPTGDLTIYGVPA